jgi:hypothetical protein
MNIHKKVILLLLAILAVAAITAMAALRSQNQQPASNRQQQKAEADDSHWPVADYEAPEPVDPKDRALRKLRSSRYDGGGPIKESTPESEVTLINEIEYPALPVANSDAVVLGEVADAQAHLSNDKKRVYSEFSVRIEELLKDNKCAPLAHGSIIITERPGGKVKFPSGQIKKYRTEGQGMPQVGRQYVFFLKHNADRANYYLVTAYELRDGKVFPVDGSIADKVSRKWSFDVYHGATKEGFLKDVRDAVKNPSQEKARIFG